MWRLELQLMLGVSGSLFRTAMIFYQSLEKVRLFTGIGYALFVSTFVKVVSCRWLQTSRANVKAAG